MSKISTNKSFGKKLFMVQIRIYILIIIILITTVHPFINATTWVQTSDKDFNNGTLNNLTIMGNAENAELVIDLTGLHNWTKKIHQNCPSGQESHGLATVWGTDKILLFGGYNAWNILNDTWVYDLSNDKWMNKTTAVAPRTRLCHAMASIYGSDKVLLFGGWDSSFPFGDNETWIYDMSNSSWTQKFPVNKPTPRFGSAMAPIWGTDKVLLFGGYKKMYCNETWIYDLSNNTWTLKTPTNKPDPTFEHAMASVYGDDKVVLFDGQGNVGETWIYDFSKDTWTQKVLANKPDKRVRHAMATIWGTDKIVMFGGLNNTHKGDTWVYDVGDNKWSRITFSGNKPSPRRDHAIATIYGTNKVVLFGGDSNKWLNDTWIYTHFISTKNGTYISYPHDTGANSTFNILSWDVNTPVNTSIKLQLRSATNLSILRNNSFVGPDGNATTYYTASPVTIWSGHNGDRWIQYLAYLNITELTDSPVLKEVSITYNCVPTTIVISPLNDSLANENKPNFEWTFDDFDSEQQKAFQVLIDNDINFENVEFDSSEQQSSEQCWEFPSGTNYTIIPDGIWYWKVRTKDGDGAWSKFSTPWKLSIDSIIPSSISTIPVNDGFYKSIDKISGIAQDGSKGSGLNKLEIVIKRLSDNFYWNGQNWDYVKKWLLTSGTTNWTYDSSNIDWTSGTKYSIQSRAVDNATNIEVPNNYNIFTIDTQSPKSDIDIPENNFWLNNIISISGTSFDLGGAGTDQVKISIKCTKDFRPLDGEPKVNNYWDGSKWTQKEAWLLSEGTSQWFYDAGSINWATGDHYNICSRASDKIENLETPSQGITIMFDDKAPDNMGIYINNGNMYTNTANAVLSLKGEDNGSGLSEMSFCTDRTNWSSWEPFASEKAFTLPSNDGESTVYFRVRDHAGNIAEPVFDTIILDTIPPEDVSIKINENVKYTNSNHVELSLNAFDLLSGLNDMSFSFDGNSWTTWEPFKPTRSISFLSEDGEKIIYFRIKDKAGNIAQTYDTIIFDSTPPYSLSILINRGAIETNTTIVLLEINAVDNKSGINKMSFSLDGKSWNNWENYSKSIYYELPTGDGLKIIYFRVSDRASNIAKPVSTTILLNTSKSITKNDNPTDSGPKNFNWLAIFLLIIIIIIIIGWAIIKGRSKGTIDELLPSGTLTIKPGLISTSTISINQTSTAQPLVQLPSTNKATISEQTSTTHIPTLATPTTPGQVPESQQIPQAAQVPQLPPAPTVAESSPTIAQEPKE